jgi:acylphosphatase
MKWLDNDTSVESLLVRISGRVQGVGYRVATVRQAHQLGICGWVRNLDNGMVEALIQGPPDQIDLMLSWCRTGPPGARVNQVSHEQHPSVRRFDRFEIH